ncbi:hypothetical protein [Pseudomonas sp. NPDC089406]|uniref:hypothetical protein n=1 Tax=Pseudomonas sp. NPDC089406 TaxID=3364463 RepID=UPI00384A620E
MVENIRSNGLAPGVSSLSGVQRVAGSLDTKTNEELQSEQEGPELSSLAKQLSAAAERAAARDATLSRKELAAFASAVMQKLFGQTYNVAKDIHDNALPDTTDPELLERARRATDFSNGKGENPFKGFSREQLSLIIYDESGAFTVNERRAARDERDVQHERWSSGVIDRMRAEYQLTGRSDQGDLEVLAFYNSLPRIEVAQYGNYEMDILLKSKGLGIEIPDVRLSLFDLMVNEWAEEADALEQDQPANPQNPESDKKL